MIRLSPHFTLEEMTYSDTANRLKIHNIPNTQAVKNLGYLAHNLLEPLREYLGKPIVITSGYRGEILNRKVGGSKTSQHLYGQAVDIWVSGISPQLLYEKIKQSGLDYDQLILEKTRNAEWVHISYTKHNRHQNLIYKSGVYVLD